MMGLPHLRRRSRLVIWGALLIAATVVGWYYWSQRIPNVTAVLGPPPEVFHDPRLDEPITITFNGTPFIDTVEQISRQVHVPIHMDPDVNRLTDRTFIYFNAHRLPARHVIGHLVWQTREDADLFPISRSDGLHLIRYIDLDEKPITLHIKIAPVWQAVDERIHPPPSPPMKLWIWANRQIGRDVGPPGAYDTGAILIIVNGVTPTSELTNMLQWMCPMLPEADPFTALSDRLQEDGDELVSHGLAQAQRRLYRTVSEIYLAAKYDYDSRQLHADGPARRRARTWMTAADPAINGESNLHDLFNAAVKHNINIHIEELEPYRASQPANAAKNESDTHTPAQLIARMQAEGKDVCYLVDEAGVITIGPQDHFSNTVAIRTYDVTDMVLYLMKWDALQLDKLQDCTSPQDIAAVGAEPSYPGSPPTADRQAATFAIVKWLDRMLTEFQEKHLHPNTDILTSHIDTVLVIKADPGIHDRLSDLLRELRTELQP